MRPRAGTEILKQVHERYGYAPPRRASRYRRHDGSAAFRAVPPLLLQPRFLVVAAGCGDVRRVPVVGLVVAEQQGRVVEDCSGWIGPYARGFFDELTDDVGLAASPALR